MIPRHCLEASFGRFFYAIEVYRYLKIMGHTVEDLIVLTTFLISLSVYFQRPSPLYLKIFPVYLGQIYLTSLCYEAFPNRKNPAMIANVVDGIEFLFFYFFLWNIIQNVRVKRVIGYALFILPLMAFLSIIYSQNKMAYNTINFSVGCLLTVILCIYYYFELLQGTETRSLARLPAFWIVTGIFFNNVCTFPIYAFVAYMKNVPPIIVRNISMIFLMVTLFSAILYSIGFLCRIRIRKSTL